MNYFQKHIFICVNQKASGKKCCQNFAATEIFEHTRAKLKELELFGMGKIRVSHSGCLGRCSVGPCLVIYPEQVWYTYANTNDIDEIIEKHCIQGETVERLLLASDL